LENDFKRKLRPESWFFWSFRFECEITKAGPENEIDFEESGVCLTLQTWKLVPDLWMTP
jgi:hypothetical protein